MKFYLKPLELHLPQSEELASRKGLQWRVDLNGGTRESEIDKMLGSDTIIKNIPQYAQRAVFASGNMKENRHARAAIPIDGRASESDPPSILRQRITKSR